MALIKKYLNLKTGKTFVGKLVGVYLGEMSDYVKDVLEERSLFYTIIFNAKLVDEIISAFTSVTTTLDSLSEKYQDYEFEQNRNWRNIISIDLAYLFNTLESYEQRFDPNNQKLSSSETYCRLTNIFSSMLDDLSIMIQSYLKIQEYQEIDRSKFFPNSQISISIVPDSPLKNIKVVPRRSGFYDQAHNKILKKEIVSIRPASLSQNDENKCNTIRPV